MLVIGLTGGIATGKSTVSSMFRDAGVPVICLDELSRLVVQPGSEGIRQIRDAFGGRVIDENGGLDRPAMGNVVFHDPLKRKELESIIHPLVAQEKNRLLEQFAAEGHGFAVVDIPLLYEVNWDKHCDMVVVVYAPKEVQKERLMERDGLSPEEAQARLDAQMSIEEKRGRADHVIFNAEGIEHTRSQVRRFLRVMGRRGPSEEA